MDCETLIKVLLVKRGTNRKKLSEMLNSSPANLYNKLRRNNLTVNDIEKIADVLDCDVEIRFIDRNTGKEV